MPKTYKIGFAVLVLVLAGIVFLEANKPMPINWTPSYAHIDKIPLGTYVFYESLKAKFPQTLKEIKKPPYTFLNETNVSGTYFFLNHQIVFAKTELKKLLSWVEKGNTLFISSQQVGEKLLDTLGIETQHILSYKTIKSQPLLNLTNPNLATEQPYHYTHNTAITYFSELDTLNQTVLGMTDIYEKEKVINDSLANFVEAPFGQGKIILHLFPEAFSNYFMLSDENHTYAEKAMAYIDFDQPVFWDAYYKVGKPIHTSLLYVLLNNRSLKWAYYLVLIGGLIFVFFEGKRKQKSIKIIPSLTNKSQEFARTVAGLYLKEKDHRAIAQKQIVLFQSYARKKWQVKIHEKLNAPTLTRLAERSGNSRDKTKELFDYIVQIQNKQKLTAKELIKLNRLISDFKTQN